MIRRIEIYQRILIAVLSLIIGLVGSYYISLIQEQQETVSARIADKIVRFHVVPDHDSREDLRLKNVVRDDMLKYLDIMQENLKTEGRDTKAEFLSEVKGSLSDMELLAESRILTEGFSYEVEVTCGQSFFPQKAFEKYVFPEGTYDAIEVLIGDAKGSNWWGIMYPNLSLTEGTYEVFLEEADAELKTLLLKDDYESLLMAPREKVHVKCKTYELVKEFLARTP